VFFSKYDRYESDGEELLKNGDFQQGLKHWEKEHSGLQVFFEEQPVLRLNSEAGQDVVSIKQTISNIQSHRFLRFSGKLKTEGVEQKENNWQSARLLFVGLNAAGQPLYDVPHVLVAQHGTRDWQRSTRVFELNDEVVRLRIEVQLAKVKGIAWAKDLSLMPIREKSAYRVYRGIAIGIWSVVAAWLLGDYLRIHGFSKQQVPVAILLCAIVVGVLMPVEMKVSLADSLISLSPWIWHIVSSFSRSVSVDTYTIGHFLAFVYLSLAVYWQTSYFRSLIQALGLLVLFAFVSEVLQFLVDGRNPQLMDFLTDVAGIFIALLICATWCASKWLFGLEDIICLNKK